VDYLWGDLLGITVGHNMLYRPVMLGDEPVVIESIELKSEYNSGMMRIAPAWKIQELLDHEDFATMREKDIKAHQQKINKTHVNDSKINEGSTVEITKEQFMAGLEASAQRIKSSSAKKPTAKK
jgi:hypothetical protein